MANSAMFNIIAYTRKWSQGKQEAVGDGTSTHQMLAAPLNSIFIIPNASQMLHYRNLARYGNRADLTIRTQYCILNDFLRGLKHHIVVDHSVQLTQEEINYLNTLHT